MGGAVSRRLLHSEPMQLSAGQLPLSAPVSPLMGSETAARQPVRRLQRSAGQVRGTRQGWPEFLFLCEVAI